MKRVKVLREQAQILRTLAVSFQDAPQLRGGLLILAKGCDQLANKAEREIAEKRLQPIKRISSA